MKIIDTGTDNWFKLTKRANSLKNMFSVTLLKNIYGVIESYRTFVCCGHR